MKRAVTTFAIAIAILGLWATSAFACHIQANCTTATLVSDRWNDQVLVVRSTGYQHWQTLNGKELTVPNNGPNGQVVRAGFHNGTEWRYVSAPYGCVKPTTTTTTTTVAPTTTTSTTEAPTSTTTSSTTTVASSSTTIPTSAPTTSSTLSIPPTVEKSTTTLPPNPSTSTTQIETGPPVSVMSPPAPPADELPHTGSNALVPVAAVGAACLLAGLAFVASKKKAQR